MRHVRAASVFLDTHAALGAGWSEVLQLACFRVLLLARLQVASFLLHFDTSSHVAGACGGKSHDAQNELLHRGTRPRWCPHRQREHHAGTP